MATETLHLQREQPPGVPPLALTGERTLPDVPEENYWYRRHRVVYEWIAQRTGFGTAANLRYHFGNITSVSPQSYRHVFRHRVTAQQRDAVSALEPAPDRSITVEIGEPG